MRNEINRSHYGRVLVKVEDFAARPAAWLLTRLNLTRQGEIGTKIIKLFLHVTQETQDKVLTERLDDPAKRWKVTTEDFRNRDKREEYLDAMKDMFKRTHTHWAPWTVIDSNNQKAARIAVLAHVVKELENSVPQHFPDADEAILALAKDALGYKSD
jgi:polyphosphate kinase 2 (PPK2 family)